MGALFPLGQIVATPGVLEVLAVAGIEPASLLARHQAGDWGEIPKEDERENSRSLKYGYRLLSSYLLENGDRAWIITEADRTSTTILLPEDY